MSVSNGLQDRRIMGLQNGQKYTVLIANKDESGNIELFAYPNNSINSVTMSDSVTPVGDTQAAIPEKVQGLLEDERCFIATAAYGYPQHPMVKTLRNFRDQFLLRYSWGRKFVKWYYKHSPALAQSIKKRNWLKALVRATLTPLVMLLKPAYGQEDHLGSNQPNKLVWAQASHATTSTSSWPSASSFAQSQQEKEQLKNGPGYINHPLEPFGLEKIVHEGSYYYRLPEMAHEKTWSLGFTYVFNFDVRTKLGTYNSFYGNGSVSIINLRYLQPLQGHWLWTYLQLGLGQSIGNGYLVNSGVLAEENYSLYLLPSIVGLQLQFAFSRYAAVYMGGGLGYLALLELRDDQKTSGFAGSLFMQARAGAEVSLTLWDRTSALQWYRDYGIGNLALYAEAGLWQFFKSDYRAPGLQWSLGLNLEY